MDDTDRYLEAIVGGNKVKGKIMGMPRRACLCDKLVGVEHTVHRYSGVVNFSELLCNDCKKEFAPFARIVCLGCKALVALQKPARMPTGFRFAQGTCYHVAECPLCKPNLFALPVLEHVRFCREQGIPTTIDKDIVQESEQKLLQTQAEAAKLAIELSKTFTAT